MIATPHRRYADLDVDVPVVDIWNLLGQRRARCDAPRLGRHPRLQRGRRASSRASTGWSTRSRCRARSSSCSTRPTTRRGRTLEKYARGRAPGRADAQHLRPGPGPRDPLRHRPRDRAGRRGHDGRRLRRPHADRRSSPAWSSGAWWSRPRRRYMPGGQQVGGAVPEGDALAAGRAARSAGSPASARTTRRTRSRRTTAAFVQRGRDRVRRRASRSGSSWWPRRAAAGCPVAEIPTIWLDRGAGQSNFKMWQVAPALPPLVLLRVRTEDHRAEAQESSTMSKIVVSGSAGFIGGYVVQELLGARARGRRHRQLLEVRPGRAQSYDDDPGYRLVEGDARDVDLMTELLADCDHFIAGAAMIGGISYFHTYAYDLLATNERIIAASCDAAIKAFSDGPAAEGHLPELVDGVRVGRRRGRRTRARSARSRRRSRPTGSRSSRSSTSPGPRATSTGCRTRSCGRSTASASARRGRSARSRC